MNFYTLARKDTGATITAFAIVSSGSDGEVIRWYLSPNGDIPWFVLRKCEAEAALVTPQGGWYYEWPDWWSDFNPGEYEVVPYVKGGLHE